MTETNQEIFGKRLAERRKKLGLTQKDLGAAVGVSVTSIQNYENGQIPRGEMLVTIGRTLGCTAEWLVTGEENNAPWDGEERRERGENARETLACQNCEVTLIPLVEARLSAGGGSWEASAESDRRYAFRTDFLRRKGTVNTMVLMRVAGDSMEPEVKDNDVVLIDTANITPSPGRLFAVAVEDLVYLKKVNAEPGKLVLTSANPAYGPLEIDARGDLNDGIKIIGKAVWVGRELD